MSVLSLKTTQEHPVQKSLRTENTVIIIISFEGPDSYSLAGGLGVRVSRLSEALARQGYETHLFFIGDPWLEGHCIGSEQRLHLHRWCQWISHYHPFGVYDGEEGKRNDFTLSLPEYVVNALVSPAAAAGRQVVVMAEEWHTADAVCRISDLLAHKGIRDRVHLLWNANNTYSFDRINWSRLAQSSTITTVSNYMRQLMKPYGVEPLVIHNGIQPQLTEPVDPARKFGFKTNLETDFTLFKMARFDPDKGWIPAVETAARLKGMGYRVVFYLRGGIEPYGRRVFSRASELGLSVLDVSLEGKDLDQSLRELLSAQNNDIINITSFIPSDLSRILFSCSDAVLANSRHEPFGLVGLEAMASGGTAYVGTTGEDYAHDFQDAVVLETSRAEEATASMLYLHAFREVQKQITQRARIAAREFIWDKIISHKLFPKIKRLTWEQRLA
ncbi:MAG: glycosyltransferase family 4 protein [Desulfovermiculus sp.]